MLIRLTLTLEAVWAAGSLLQSVAYATDTDGLRGSAQATVVSAHEIGEGLHVRCDAGSLPSTIPPFRVASLPPRAPVRCAGQMHCVLPAAPRIH
jgi:hypothetical protein